MSKFEITNLSNKMADCFLIELENVLGETATILVDGNQEKACKASFEEIVDAIISLGKKLDLIIITHVDDDHLGGILRLFEYADSKSDAKAKQLDAMLDETEVIYNYVTRGTINYSQAKKLEDLLIRRKLSHSCKMYYDTKIKLLNIYRHEKRKGIRIRKGHTFRKAYLTFISPDKEGVNAVIKDYEDKKKKKSDIVDKPLVNKNSIVFILEFGEKCAIFGADAYWDQVQPKLDGIDNMSQVEIIKIPHHGAANNNKGMVNWAKSKKCTQFILTVPAGKGVLHPSEELAKELEDYHNAEGIKVYTNFANQKIALYADQTETIKIL